MYLIFILVVIFLICNQNEGYTGYMENKSTHDYPDDTVFFACSENLNVNDCDQHSDKNSCNNDRNCIFKNNQCKNKKYPKTHYKVSSNAVKEPLDGTFSAFLDVNKIRTYDHFYHSPICEDTYEFISDTKNQNRPIIQEEDEINGLLMEEKKLDELISKDPFFTYESANYNGNRILYDSKLQTMFLEVKDGLRRKDDFSHLEGYNTAYDVNTI